jgi:hypothetical protein
MESGESFSGKKHGILPHGKTLVPKIFLVSQMYCGKRIDFYGEILGHRTFSLLRNPMWMIANNYGRSILCFSQWLVNVCHVSLYSFW